MSEVKASTDSTPGSSGERSSRASELGDEINKKLAQARGICGVMLHVQGIDEPIAESMSAAEDLIEDAQKAFTELRHIHSKTNRDRC